jgi:hypothetical protein
VSKTEYLGHAHRQNREHAEASARAQQSGPIPEATLAYGRAASRARTTDSPVLVVDGHPLSMVDLERILRSYEGWRVELRIVDATE